MQDCFVRFMAVTDPKKNREEPFEARRFPAVPLRRELPGHSYADSPVYQGLQQRANGHRMVIPSKVV